MNNEWFGDVWICDLHNIILLLARKCPEILTFRQIYGTPTGNICIVTSTHRYIVKQEDFSLWKEIDAAIWEEIK